VKCGNDQFKIVRNFVACTKCVSTLLTCHTYVDVFTVHFVPIRYEINFILTRLIVLECHFPRSYCCLIDISVADFYKLRSIFSKIQTFKICMQKHQSTRNHEVFAWQLS